MVETPKTGALDKFPSPSKTEIAFLAKLGREIDSVESYIRTCDNTKEEQSYLAGLRTARFFWNKAKEENE